MNRKILLLVICIAALLAVSTASAADNLENVTGSVEEAQTIEQSGDNLEDLSQDDVLGQSKTVEGDNFTCIQDAIDSAQDGDTIYLGGKTYNGNGQVISINKSITIVGGFKDGDNVYSTLDAQKLSRIMAITANNVTVKGITFINANVGTLESYPYWGNGGGIWVMGYLNNISVVNCTFNNNVVRQHGGAIYANSIAVVSVVNCTFNNNVAKSDGGAISKCNVVNCIFNNNSAANMGGAIMGSNVVNCVFVNNSARDGGAVSSGSAVNCTFNNNSASDGGAMSMGSAVNCVFVNNSANDKGGAVSRVSATDCVFVNNSASWGGAMYDNSAVNCTFNINSASRGGAMYEGSAVDCTFNNNSATQSGGAMYECSARDCVFNNNSANYDGGAMHEGSAVNCVFNNNNSASWGGAMYKGSADSCIFKPLSGSTYNTICSNPIFTVFNYTSLHGSGDRLKFNLTSNNGIPISNRNITVDIYKDDICVGTYHCISGEELAIDLNVGLYVAVCRLSDFNITPVNATLTIMRSSEITCSPITVTYNSDKYLTITLRDDMGRPISGVSVSVELNDVKTFTTDKNGQIKVSTKNLTPKKYSAKITFNGKGIYDKSTNEVKVTVKKATLKITAKAKTFNAKKTKKYTATLKSSKNAVKKAKIILKIKGKTFKAKTNTRGKAIFNLKKLAKGSFNAKIIFKGNNCYNKAVKKVKITVK